MKNPKMQLWVKLPCLCLIVATMAFTMGAFTAPFLSIAGLAASSEEPARQLMRQNRLWTDFAAGSSGSGYNRHIPEELPPLPSGRSHSVVPEREEANNKGKPITTEDSSTKEDIEEKAGDKEDVSNKDEAQLQLPPEPDKKCDIFQGKWVEDDSEPLYRNETCPFLSQGQNCPGNGRTDSGYLNWRWKPAACELPPFDGNAFLELMRGKTLAFIGDSVTRNQFESLMCTLWQVAKPHPNGNRKFQRWVFREYNFKVIRIWSSWLVRASTAAVDFAPANMTKLHLTELDDKIAEFLPSFDVLVVASGHWWPKTAAYVVDGKVVGGQGWWNKTHTRRHDVLSGYSVAMKTALTAIMSHPEYKGLTILRTYSPEHYEGGSWNTGGSCTGKTRPLTDAELAVNTYMDTLYGHQMAAAAAAAAVGRAQAKKLRVMDITRAFAYRPDGHPGPYRNNDPKKVVTRGADGKPPPQDCLHWCMPGPIDTWNQYLFEMLKREF